MVSAKQKTYHQSPPWRNCPRSRRRLNYASSGKS